jgi:hypothetical protein
MSPDKEKQSARRAGQDCCCQPLTSAFPYKTPLAVFAKQRPINLERNSCNKSPILRAGTPRTVNTNEEALLRNSDTDADDHSTSS